MARRVGIDVVVVGSYMRDVTLVVDAFPRPGETVMGRDRRTTHGGKGSNQAVQAARCGAHTAIIAAVGEDEHGRDALRFWQEEGIDTAGVRLAAEAPTGLATILVDRSGENQIVIDPGANLTLNDRDVRTYADLLTRASLVVAQLETPAAATRAAFEAARQAGTLTLLNAAPVSAAQDDALLAATDILVVNEVEAATVAGMALGSDPLAIGRRLQTHAGRAVILTLGADGAALFGPEAEFVRLAAARIEPVDTTGAGDAFIGAFAARFAQTRDWRDALAWGVAAGTLACKVRGAVPSLARREAIRAAAAVAA